MSAGEADDAQSAIEDGAGGPGAPTPLTVLEASISLCDLYSKLIFSRVLQDYQHGTSNLWSREGSIPSSRWHIREESKLSSIVHN